MLSKDNAFEKISGLVTRFEEQFDSYKKPAYNETLTRRDFIDPFFKALGWDIDNENGYAEAYREVIHEDKVKVGKATKAPDYSFRIGGGKRLFFVEAKKPSVYVKDEIQPAYQVRRYGWSAKLAVSIITDFEEFAIYDCTKKPNPTDKTSVARIKYLTFKDYLNEFEFLWDTFSKERVLKGSFDKFVQGNLHKKGTATVDKEFLQSLDKWRTHLATNISKNNKNLDEDEINFVVQQTIDRIIFLRIAEDRSVEPYGTLQEAIKQGDFYNNLFRQFQQADDKYNSGLFDFKKDKISKTLSLDNKVLKSIINELYYPESPYEFSVLSVEILGSAYEQFLGKTITIDKAHRVKIEEKPEVRKAGGVYYTPQYVVEYIVKNTVGKLIEELEQKHKSKAATSGKGLVDAVSKIKIVDPACGSGSFLIGAYQYLLDWHKNFYSGNEKKNNLPLRRRGARGEVLTPEGNLTTAEKKRILLNNIFGVDIDVNAVEVTKLSLLLKCMEGETEASIASQLSLFNERVLPTLDNNIKDGNSLIDLDFYDGQLDFGEEKKIKPFSWQNNFPEVFRQGGFDAVIGNPPYIPIEFFSEDEKNYYKKHFPELTRKFETSVIFILKGLELLNSEGYLGFISTQTWQTGENYTGFRQKLFKEYGLIQIINLPFNVFKDAYVDTGIFLFSKKSKSQYQFFAFNKKVNIDLIENLNFETIQTSNIIPPDYKVVLNYSIGNLSQKFKSNYFIELGDISISTQGLSVSRFTRADNVNEDWVLPFINAKVKRYTFIVEDKFNVDLKNQKSLYKFYTQNEKILVRRIINRQNRLDATFFNQEGVFKKDLNPFIITDDSIKTKYVLGLINSLFFSWLYLNSSTIATKDDFRQTTLTELRKLPIKRIDFKNETEQAAEAEIIKLVDQLLKLNQEKAETKLATKISQLENRIDYCENKINEIVYQLYGLTEDEIKIIEAVK